MSRPDAELVSLPVPGGHLVGDYRPGGGRFAVLWVHGFGSHRGGDKALSVAAECGRRGWPFAAFDFRGHGASAGAMHELTASALLHDLGTIATFLKERGHDRLGLVGSSMGGFASAWFANRNPASVVGCVLLAPAFGFLERRWNALSDYERNEWERTDRLRVTNEWVDAEIGYGLVREREAFAPATLAAGWATPTLIFHGCADDVVPDADSLGFLRAVAYPRVELRLLKDGDHRLTAYKGEIAAEAGRFFAGLSG